MNQILEVLVKLLSLLAILISIIRLFISIHNRSVLEIILTSNSTRKWEEIVEILLAVFFLAISLNLPVIISDLVINENVLGYLVIIDLFVFVISLSIIMLYMVTYWITHRIKKFVKIVNIAIFANMISVFFSSSLGTILLKSNIVQLIKNNNYLELILIFLTIYIFFVSIFYLSRNAYVTFNGIKQVAYKVKLIDTNILNTLYFVFALDNDRHVFSNYPMNRTKISLPAYVYYPKEKVLYKYFKES